MILDKQAVPRDGQRTTCLDPTANAMSVSGLSGLYNPSGTISENFRSGMLGNALGFDFVMDQNVYTFNAGSRVISGNETTTTVAWTAGSALTSTFVFTAAAGDNGLTLKAGDTFTIANVYSVNWETQQSTGLLQQFVVTADKTLATGANNIAVFPTPKVAGAGIPDGNVYVASTSATAAVVWTTGAASTASPQSLAYHKDAFTLGTADMEIPAGVGFGSRESHDGISMRILRDYDIMNDFVVCRIDVLGGFANLRPDMAVRIAG
jgi:hypothetical protein